MAGFKDIVGHEQIIEHLKTAIEMGKVSHAYILNGPDLSGKMMIAEAFARALLCEKQDPDGCGECRSCRQSDDRNNPDIIYVKHDKPNAISVDDIRTQLNNDIVIKPYSNQYKIYIVDEAEKRNYFMEIRKASAQDLDQIMQIYENAKAFMRENGNKDQWGDDYPSRELIEQDLDDMYLCMAENQIACVFYYKKDEDEEYGQINGKWLNDEPYAVVHRVASTGIIKGAASYCLDWAYSQIPNLRMDTYRDNIPMQKLLEKCGFQYCGSFERLGTDKWMAYHKA